MLVLKNENIDLSRILKFLGLSVLILVASFFIEFKKQNPLINLSPSTVFSIVSDNPNSDLAVSYDLAADPENLQVYSGNQQAFPTYIQANTDLSLKIYENTYLTLAPKTKLRTLIFTKDKLHIHLISGQAILDTRQSEKSILLQTDNLLLKPFLHGLYTFNKDETQTEIYTQSGQAILGIYSDKGNLQDKVLLPKKNLLAYEDKFNIYNYDLVSQLEPPAYYKETKDLNLIRDLEADIRAKQLLSLQFKGQIISPDQNKSFFADLSSTLALNETKRDYLNLYPFIKELNAAQEAYLAKNVSGGNIALKQAQQEFTFAQSNSVQSVNSFTRFLDKIYPVYVRLSAQDDLEPFKLNLIENYSANLHQNVQKAYQQEAVFSLLEDIYYYYQEDSIALAQDTTDKLSQILKIWSQADDETLIFMNQILDNILFSFPKSNNQKTYELRQNLYNLITTDTYLKDYQKQNALLLANLKTYFYQKQVATTYIKQSIQILRDNLSDLTLHEFSEFIEEVDKKALE